MASIPDFFGLDIGSSGIKVCETVKHGKAFEVVALSAVSVDPILLQNQTPDGITKLAAKVDEAVKQSGTKTKRCVMSIPESSVFSRLVTLPEMNEDSVEEAVHWAMKPLIPVPIETLNLTFLKIDSFKRTGKNYVNWYVVAAQKEYVQRFQVVLQRTPYELLAIETEALALARLIYQSYQQSGDALIVDIGAHNTNLVIARNGVVVFSQTVGTASKSMTKVIASDFGIDETQADKYKVAFGMDFNQGEGKIAKSVQPIVDIIANEVSRTITYYTSKIGGQKLAQIYLTGGGGNLTGLNEYLSTKLGVDIIKVQISSENITVNKKLSEKFKSQIDLSAFNVSLGLSMKSRTIFE